MNSDSNHPHPDLVARLRAELPLKLTLLVVLYLWVYVPYLFLQRHHFFPVTQMPAGAFDRLIPFSDQAIWPYLSIYLLLPVGPFLMNTRGQILRYAAGTVMMSLLADLIFLFWPTFCPRPDPAGANAVYRALISVDNPFHACPSLHAAFAVYSAGCGGLVLRELGAGRRWRAGLELWVLLILLATLATRQHVASDLAAGAALGFACYFLAYYSWKPRARAVLPPPASSTSTLADPTLL